MYLGGGLVLAAATGREACYLALGALLAGMASSWYRRCCSLARSNAPGLIEHPWPEPTPTARANAPGPIQRLLWVAIGALGAVDLLLAAYTLDWLWRPPVLITMLTLAAVLGAGRRLRAGRGSVTAAPWAVYGLVALTAAGPLIGWGVGEALTSYALTVAGLALVVTGMVDHQRPTNMSGPATETTAGDAAAGAASARWTVS